MIKFLNKPYVFAIIFTLGIFSFSTFVLLDTFVIPKRQDINQISNSNNKTNEEFDNTEKENNIEESSNGTEGSKIKSIITGKSYKDNNIEISIETARENNTTYYVADIVINDPSYLKTAFANNTYGRNIKEKTSTIAEENNSILAINGDYYGFRNSGYVLRNGVVYRDSLSTDNYGEDLVIDSEGNFKIINENEISIKELENNGAIQVFSFGPALVENGQSVIDEGDEVGKAMVSNPRTAIGQVGPLHYIRIVSDGRTNESEGFSLKELSNILVDRGCITAYNLDGGGSSTMVFNGEVINNPTTNGKSIKEREVSDIVYIGY
ncbi:MULTISPECIES: phosphodiester glycosidase family protein [unclassified Clostridium]|uniref:phosphodiester glycosidase family protein n=1 Tax=unclassified Clostridium TaxID=2614128 RepID=UPI0025B97BB4|nr:phosphodiester glycosidase family protein [Clostridium sp.]MDY4253651.1 phosphodiester glycosidase family protein [Clostridium sp.]